MNKRKPIKKQHEQAIVTDFLGWYNSIGGTKFVIVAEPEPPEAVAKYEDKYIWLEVADVFHSDGYAKDLCSYATPDEKHEPMGPGPFMNVDERFAHRFVNVLKDKLSKASYEPFYKSYGPGILLLAVHSPWFDEKTMITMRSQCRAANWSDNLEFFGNVFTSFFSSEGRTLWCEPHLPDNVHSQLPAFQACSASNSTGGRYPRLECNLFLL